MRISDWSSDVCSSDLKLRANGFWGVLGPAEGGEGPEGGGEPGVEDVIVPDKRNAFLLKEFIETVIGDEDWGLFAVVFSRCDQRLLFCFCYKHLHDRQGRRRPVSVGNRDRAESLSIVSYIRSIPSRNPARQPEQPPE